MTDNTQRARELLADAYAAAGFLDSASDMRKGRNNYGALERASLSAIAAALSQQPEARGVVDGPACRWQRQDEYGDHVSTGCGHEFILNDASEYEDGQPALPFCCYCAKPTVFRQWRDELECSCDNSDGRECEGCAQRRSDAALTGERNG